MPIRRVSHSLLAFWLLCGAATAHADQAEPPLAEAPEAPVAEAPAPDSRTEVVNCGSGSSIAKALEQPAAELIVEIRGVCTENVVVSRDRVTLRGRNPQGDGIRSAVPDTREPTLMIRGARQVTIDGLAISGSGWDGMRVLSAHDQIEVTDSRLEDNAYWGGSIIDSTVTLRDVRVSRNGSTITDVPRGGLMVARGSSAALEGCDIVGNPQSGVNVGVVVYSNSTLTLNGGTAEGRIAVLAQQHSSAAVNDAELSASEWAFQANYYGDVTVRGGSFSGSFLALGNSAIQLFGAAQVVNPAQNLVTQSSTLLGDDRDSDGSQTALAGLTQVTEFSNGKLIDGSVAEDLVCSLEARVFCDSTTSKRSSNCGLCP